MCYLSYNANMHTYSVLYISYKTQPPNGCSNNGSVSLFKAMLQWLANCSIEDSLFCNSRRLSCIICTSTLS